MEEVDTVQNLHNSSGSQEEGVEGSLCIGDEENALKFLDSIDVYLILMNSLSSTLRQGWLELASARYSMGASRVDTALFDHKNHSASTTLSVVGSELEQPLFSLHKWVSSQNPKSPSVDETLENDESLQNVSGSQEMWRKDPPVSSDIHGRVADGGSPGLANDQAQKERFKLLSMFGILVSPKLRSAQLSFETALETLADLANTRASLLCAYDVVGKEMKSSLD